MDLHLFMLIIAVILLALVLVVAHVTEAELRHRIAALNDAVSAMHRNNKALIAYNTSCDKTLRAITAMETPRMAAAARKMHKTAVEGRLAAVAAYHASVAGE